MKTTRESKPPANVYHGNDREAACQRAIAISGHAYELHLAGPWDGFWSGPCLPSGPHTPVLNATDRHKV